MAGAVATITKSKDLKRVYGRVHRVDIAWHSDSSSGAVTSASIELSGELVGVLFKPGLSGVQPTAAYDVNLLDDSTAQDALNGSGANRADTYAAATEWFVPWMTIMLGTTEKSYGSAPIPLCGTYKVAVTNAGNSKEGTVTLFIRN